MQGRSSIHENITSMQHHSSQSADEAPANFLVISIAIAIPVILLVGIASYRKFRAVVMRQQIQRLNKTWKLSSSQYSDLEA